jgi:hypothetical protein
MLNERFNANQVSPKCQACNYLCGGIGKGLLTIEEIGRVPSKCFVEEVDLTEEDKKIISNYKRDGALVALIDSLIYEEQQKLQSSISCVDKPHYIYNERGWVDTAKYFFGKQYGREPSADELFELNVKNDPKYRIQYTLLFPHMIDINDQITPENLSKLTTFLKKADDVAAENIKKYGFNGACGLFTMQMIKARQRNRPFVPNYERIIIDKDF